MTLVSQMRGTPPMHVVRMSTALPVGPKPPLMSRHYASVGLDVGLRACVLPTGKFPPLTPLREISHCARSEMNHTPGLLAAASNGLRVPANYQEPHRKLQ